MYIFFFISFTRVHRVMGIILACKWIIYILASLSSWATWLILYYFTCYYMFYWDWTIKQAHDKMVLVTSPFNHAFTAASFPPWFMYNIRQVYKSTKTTITIQPLYQWDSEVKWHTPSFMCLSMFIDVSSVYYKTDSKGSGETVRMRKLAWAFAAHKFISTWPK